MYRLYVYVYNMYCICSMYLSNFCICICRFCEVLLSLHHFVPICPVKLGDFLPCRHWEGEKTTCACLLILNLSWWYLETESGLLLSVGYFFLRLRAEGVRLGTGQWGGLWTLRGCWWGACWGRHMVYDWGSVEHMWSSTHWTVWPLVLVSREVTLWPFLIKNADRQSTDGQEKQTSRNRMHDFCM